MTMPHKPTAASPYRPTATPTLGILMLKTAFPRPRGDVGNPATWSVPTRYRVVETAIVASVVKSGPLPLPLLMAFIEAGWALVEEGATLITTSCGFLVTAQKALAEALPVPVVTSSLLQIPEVQAGLPAGRRVGIVTFDALRLGPAHLAAAGAPADTPVIGLEGGSELHRVISGDLPRLDARAAEADLLAAGATLKARCPGLGAVVLECTNLPPYRAALARHLRLPVHDLVTLVEAQLAGGQPL
ncbi:MAG: aspartate/glutamate racemase family protein [Kiloniellaceae bacterium]